MLILAAAMNTTSPDIVAFAGGIVADSNPAGSTATFTINADGTHTSLSGDTQWVTPNPPGETYWIRWQSGGGKTPDVTPFAINTWVQITGAGPFSWSESASSPDVDTANFNLLISNDGGTTTLDSGIVTLQADATP